MRDILNAKIKLREKFRPFAPSVLREHADEYFELFGHPSPYMLQTAYVHKSHRRAVSSDEEKLWGIEKLNAIRSDIPAVTHVDYSARVQTVERDVAPRYHALLEAFRKRTGCALLVNTSFNVRSEPIVCSPQDAYVCFMRTDMDYLVLGNYIVDKKKQPEWKEATDWRTQHELD